MQEEVSEYYRSRGLELLEDYYCRSDEMECRCLGCGSTHYRSLSALMNSDSIKCVGCNTKMYSDVLSKLGIRVIGERDSYSSDIRYICLCGTRRSATPRYIRESKNLLSGCTVCSSNKLRSQLESGGCTLIGMSSSKTTYRCKCGGIVTTRSRSIIQGKNSCIACTNIRNRVRYEDVAKRAPRYEDVAKTFTTKGDLLLTEMYCGVHQVLRYQCHVCNEVHTTTYERYRNRMNSCIL